MNNPKVQAALGWTLFSGSHMVMSHPPVRQSLVDKFGEQQFQGVYSLVAIATFAPMCVAYYRFNKNRAKFAAQNAQLITPTTTLRTAGTALNTMAVVTLGQAIATPSPSGQHVKQEVKGLTRVTRHGMFMSMALFGSGQFLRTGTVVDLIFWGGLPLFWIIGSLHQDYRQKMTHPKEFYDQTSLLPFKAIIEGRNDINKALQEMSIKALVASLVVGLALRQKAWRYLPKLTVRKQ